MSSFIAAVLKAGLPRELLIPILPHDITLKDEPPYDDKGKAPGYWNNYHGGWRLLPEWTRGASNDRLVSSEEHGCNVGLLLGCPSLQQDLQYCFLDLDLLGKNDDPPNLDAHDLSVRCRNAFLLVANQLWGKDLLIRQTVEPRLGLLVAIPGAEDPGTKTKFHLRHPDYHSGTANFGQVEVLTVGQQCVVGGKHWSGNEITWLRASELAAGQRQCHAAPSVTQGVPTFASFQAVIDAITVALNEVAKQIGITFTTKSFKASSSACGQSADERMPRRIGATEVIEYFQNAKHPPWVDREEYIQILFAAAGCEDALRVQGRLTAEQQTELLDAVVTWASIYKPRPGGKATTYEAEWKKFHDDIRGRPFYQLGWEFLIRMAEKLGVVYIKHREATQFFNSPAAQPLKPPPILTAADQYNAVLTPRVREADVVHAGVPEVDVLDVQENTAARPTQIAPRPAEQSDNPLWQNRLDTDPKGKYLCHLHNIMIAMREEPRLVNLFAYDQMRYDIMLMQPIPGVVVQLSDSNFKPRPVLDFDTGRLLEFLIMLGFKTVTKDTVREAITQRALERTFHPLQQYLNNLRWDGVPRVRKWLTTYFGAEDNNYTNAVGQMFLISMVARAFQPGCQVDYTLILEGNQGERKSSALRALAGNEYFSDNLPAIRDGGRDLSQHLRGKWLIELGELSVVSKADVETVKAFLTRRVEIYRPPYGHREVTEPRHNVFTGSTNLDVYLRDETGNRRYWPVKTGVLNVEGLARDRDQLFAETVVLHRSGAQWWPDRDFEAEHIAPEQEARFEADPWEVPILMCLLQLAAEAEKGSKPVRVRVCEDVGRRALSLDPQKIGIRESRRIGACLRRLGWQEKGRTGRARYYVPTSDWDAIVKEMAN